MSRDPDTYKDPDTFNPSRFLGPTPERDPALYVFGFGRRCVSSSLFWILKTHKRVLLLLAFVLVCFKSSCDHIMKLTYHLFIRAGSSSKYVVHFYGYDSGILWYICHRRYFLQNGNRWRTVEVCPFVLICARISNLIHTTPSASPLAIRFRFTAGSQKEQMWTWMFWGSRLQSRFFVLFRLRRSSSSSCRERPKCCRAAEGFRSLSDSPFPGSASS